MNEVRDVVYFVTEWFDRNKVGKVVVCFVTWWFNEVLNAGIDEHEVARMFVGVEVSLESRVGGCEVVAIGTIRHGNISLY